MGNIKQLKNVLKSSVIYSVKSSIISEVLVVKEKQKCQTM